ncbi:MAG TPA: nuclease-related domain-containing protein [Actinophytocola sp.]|jgi:hypothetical protein|uniref:nuclease-related domain-containing protein n=1 Tax=Actinophytocola sp. TaxID=1872138 RepID=UPI002E0970F8|nr:nuclease-related domain-containing protein [Actinophytocola sp.]
MRVEVLSDHGGEQLWRTEQQLRSAEANTAAWADRYRQSQDYLRVVRSEKPLWKRIFAVPTPTEREARAHVQETWQEVVHADVGRQQAFGRRQQRAAGLWGEDTLAWALSVLPDEWVMLRGYHNRRGETDHVLVGPQGVWAVEVKRRRVRLNVAGDQWWYEKLDSYGNVVETGPAVDGGGRSWARQVNDIAGDLTSWLNRKGHQIRVSTAVMLLHERAQLGRIEDLTVDLLANHPRYLLDELYRSPPALPPQTCADIVGLIRRDHQFHAERRRHRRS